CTPGHYWYSARGSKPKRSLYILCRGGPHDGHSGTGIGVISTVPTVIIDGRWVCDDLVLAKSINKFLKLACSSRGGLCQYRSLSTRKLRSDLYRLSDPYHGCFEECSIGYLFELGRRAKSGACSGLHP